LLCTIQNSPRAIYQKTHWRQLNVKENVEEHHRQKEKRTIFIKIFWGRQ
jgi:hypothetical protein